MYGTEFARISGSYSTAFIGTYEVIEQSTAGNYTKFKLRGYFYYGGGTSVGSQTGNGFYLDGTYLASGNYRYYPGYTLLGEKEITVNHNNDGSFPGRYVGISASSFHMSGETGGNIYANKIDRMATITKANDFNDEENPYMEFTNPANFKINLRLEFSGSIISRNGLSGSGGYTFELTDAERILLRQKATTNNLTVRYVVATLVDGSNESLWSYVDKTMTLINANPEFNSFEFEDVNPITVALTGNNKNIIMGQSDIKVTIPVANKAIAIKEATMKNYRFTCGDRSEPIEYSEDKDTSAIMHGVPNGVFAVFATDNRNNSTKVEKLANEIISYSPLVKGNIDVFRTGGVSEEVTLKLDGTINEVDFGAKTNSIISATVQYRIAGTQEWSDEELITLEVSDGRFSYDGAISGDLESKGFDISNSYEIQVMVFDELSGVQYTDTFGSGVPNLAYHKNGISVMGKYDVEVGGKFQVGGKCYDHNVMTIFAQDRFGVTVISQTPNKLNGLTSYLSVGDKLTYLDSSIRIGGGISKVLVSGAISFWHSTNFSQSILMITKNGQAVLQRYNQSPSDQYETESIVLSPVILEVSEGDEIALNFYSGAEQTVEILTERKDTNLTIEVIE